MNTLSLDNPTPKTSLGQFSIGSVSLFPPIHRKKWKEKKKKKKKNRKAGRNKKGIGGIKKKKKDTQIMP